jgi:hypothetical protein
MVISSTDDSINLLVRSSINSTIRRYCVELAKLPNDHTINITNFGWHNPYIASPSVNACNTTDLKNSLPRTFSLNTLLILSEHQCKMTEHAWNVQEQFGQNISLMILTNRTNTHYELTYNSTIMDVSIAVLIFWQNDFNKLNKTYDNISNIQISISYPLELPRKFRPAVLLMFLLVLFILLCGNFWATDEFKRKVKDRHINIPTSESISVSVNTTPVTSHNYSGSSTNNNNGHDDNTNIPKPNQYKIPSNNEPAVISMSYCVIGVILCFAIGWLLLIYYFPKVMIYILQGNRNKRLVFKINFVYFSYVLYWCIFFINFMS